ncbi:MAG: ABC transporter permease, partial [Janthinobacterium lividum]
MIALRYAARELRAGVRGLRIVLACLALGVAAIAAVGSLREGIEAGLASEGRRLLGGDLEVQTGAEAPPDDLRTWLRARGGQVSDIVGMRSMLVVPGPDGTGGERQLVELKAVDGAYPLVGQAALTPPGTLQDVLATRDGKPGLVAEQLVLDRLGVQPGALLRLGNSTVQVRAALASEPDRVATPSILGPRAMISTAALPGTGLVQPGSLLTYDLRVALPPGTDVAALSADLRLAFPNQGWRLRNASEAAPGVARF